MNVIQAAKVIAIHIVNDIQLDFECHGAQLPVWGILAILERLSKRLVLRTFSDSPPASESSSIDNGFESSRDSKDTGRAAKPAVKQVIFFHKPSRFLIVTDLFWNYPQRGTQFGTQAWKLGMDRIYGPFYRSFMIREKRKHPKVSTLLDAACFSQLPAIGFGYSTYFQQ